MTFISYAQHGEDVILWRALGSRADVTYVDVGAFDPTEDSVTRALYERGWRGVNLEAQQDRIAAFETDRPEDVNLAVAVGKSDGTATLALPENPGWATVREPEGGLGAGETRHITVPMRSLGTLLPELGFNHVDVLKIDVEGAEASVVRGLLAGEVRPTVCVVEGVSPGFGRAAGDEAVELLVGAGYTHCMFDGLNHYLTTDETLVEALSLPANPVDGYLDYRLVHATKAYDDLVESLGKLTAEKERLAQHAAVREERRREAFIRLLSAPGVGGPGAVAAVDPAALQKTPPRSAVTTIYRMVLGREPDRQGLEQWLEKVEHGMPLVTVATRLSKSGEAKELSEGRRRSARRFVRRWRALDNLFEVDVSDDARRIYSRGKVRPEVFAVALYRVALARDPSRAELGALVDVIERHGRRAALRRMVRRGDALTSMKRRGVLAARRPALWRLAELRESVADAEVAAVAALAAIYTGRPRRQEGDS